MLAVAPVVGVPQHPLRPDRAHDRRQRRRRRAPWAIRSISVRFLATTVGGFLAGVGGAFLSLYYPGQLERGPVVGQGLMAVALVIFARWNPLACFVAALLFGAAGALGPALQSVGITQGYYFFNAAPYMLTLFIMIALDLAEALAARRAGRTVDHQVSRMSMTHATSASPSRRAGGHTSPADPYPWPYDGDLRPDNTALIIIDMQTDFCGTGRLCRHDGLRPVADPRADRADPARARGDARARATTSSTPARATGPTSPTCPPTSAGARAGSAPASATRARAGASWCAASRAGRSSPSSRRCRASRSSTSPARARSAPPTSS